MRRLTRLHNIAADKDTVSVRAYGAQAAFREELHRRLNEYTRVARTQFNLNRPVDLVCEFTSRTCTEHASQVAVDTHRLHQRIVLCRTRSVPNLWPREWHDSTFHGRILLDDGW